MAKQSKFAASPTGVRTRRAYFDCKFGQIHVRTAFPTTGGFDEGVTLFCLHPSEETSRTFGRFLPEIADDRSAYAPDLPGCGESDPAPTLTYADAAAAVADLAADLRLRQIDVLGLRFGAGVALQLGAVRPDLVRRLVLIGIPQGIPPGVPLIDQLPVIKQESLVLRIKVGAGDDAQWSKGVLPQARFVDLAEYSPDLFDASPRTLAKQIGAFLRE